MKLRFHFVMPLLLASAARCFAAGPPYSLAELPDFGYGGTAQSLNDAGQVTGGASLADGTYEAFVWSQADGLVDLGTLPGDTSSTGLKINDVGQATGYSQSATNSTTIGFLWQAQTGMVNPASQSGLLLAFTDINNQGQIVGSARASPDQPGYGFVFTASSGVTPVNIPGVPVDSVLAINDSGQMVLSTPSYSNSLFYTPGQVPVQIQGTGITQATALALNDSGTAVGFSSAGEGANTHAFLWTQSGGMVDLTPGEDAFGMAYAINAAGDVVGVQGTGDGPSNPFLYEGGVMYDLDTLLGASAAGWSDMFPEAINDSGQIAGIGTFDGQTEAFLLTPSASPSTLVPEPASLGVLALGALALLLRRGRGGRGRPAA